MLAKTPDRRLCNLELTAKLGYLNHVSEEQLASWIERLGTVLRSGIAWLPPRREEDPPILDDAELYIELEDQGFPPLVTLQKEAGKRELLAAFVLHEISRGNRDVALEMGARLRYYRFAEIARKADRARTRRVPSIRRANFSRLANHQDRAAKVTKEAQALLSAGRDRRDIASLIAVRNKLSPSQVRKILNRTIFKK